MKKNKQNVLDIVLLLLLIFLTMLLINPLDIIMPSSVEMVILGVTTLVVSSILVFIWNENPKDERDEQHLLIAGRVSFFAVSITLLAALITGYFQHDLDPWIPTCLLVLITSKFAALASLRNKR